MTKSSVIYFILSVVLIIYLFFAVSLSNSWAGQAECKGVVYDLTDDSRFVTAEDIDHELGYFRDSAMNRSFDEISLSNIEKRLAQLSVIETAKCYRLNNDILKIEVTPMRPRARVFEAGESYYINHDGKKLTANARYQIDVPVVYGYFDQENPPLSMMPVVEAIESSAARTELVSALKRERNGDIILVPNIVGHVVNLGDTTDIEGKFDRLMAFYRNVMPVKGWSYYDTISVKFAGQVVAKIARKQRPLATFEYVNDNYIEEIDDESLSDLDESLQLLKPKVKSN